MECLAAFNLGITVMILNLFHKEKSTPVPMMILKLMARKRKVGKADNLEDNDKNVWQEIAVKLDLIFGVLCLSFVIIVTLVLLVLLFTG